MDIKESGFWPWILQRLSGVLLSAGVLFHFWTLHYASSPNYSIVAARLNSPYWISFYLVILAVLIFHGLNGLWAILLDFGPSGIIRSISLWALYSVGAIIFVVGAVILFSFGA